MNNSAYKCYSFIVLCVKCTLLVAFFCGLTPYCGPEFVLTKREIVAMSNTFLRIKTFYTLATPNKLFMISQCPLKSIVGFDLLLTYKISPSCTWRPTRSGRLGWHVNRYLAFLDTLFMTQKWKHPWSWPIKVINIFWSAGARGRQADKEWLWWIEIKFFFEEAAASGIHNISPKLVHIIVVKTETYTHDG